MVVTLCNWIWRILITAVLLLAVYGKWQEGIRFLPPETIYDRVVAYSPIRHYGILAVELAIALWVLSSLKPRWSAIAAGLMFSFFTVIIGIEIFRNSPALCGCGITQVYPDGDPRVELGFSMARNILLLIGCAWLWLMSEDEKRPEEAPREPHHAEAS